MAAATTHRSLLVRRSAAQALASNDAVCRVLQRELISLPLRPSLLGGAALVFVFGMRELDAAILVPAANGTAMFRVYNAIHFGRDDFVAALALLIVFFILLPGILWSAFGRERAEASA